MIGGSGYRMELRFWRGFRYRLCESLKYDYESERLRLDRV